MFLQLHDLLLLTQLALVALVLVKVSPLVNKRQRIMLLVFIRLLGGLILDQPTNWEMPRRIEYGAACR